jgi:hypothetical protein
LLAVGLAVVFFFMPYLVAGRKPSSQPFFIPQPSSQLVSNDTNSKMETYYFRGKDVFDIALSSNRPPKYGVYFYGPGKSSTTWLDRRGIGSFTERIFYDTNGDFSKHEVCVDNTWQPVVRRNGKNGLVIDGRWHQLVFDANGALTIEGALTNR